MSKGTVTENLSNDDLVARGMGVEKVGNFTVQFNAVCRYDRGADSGRVCEIWDPGVDEHQGLLRTYGFVPIAVIEKLLERHRLRVTARIDDEAQI